MERTHDMRVLLADDDASFRRALTRVLETEPDIQIVGEAQNGDVAIELTRQLHPDAILMDSKMPGMDGIEATRRIHAEFPEICIVGLSSLEDPHLAKMMTNAGAFSFLVKGESPDVLMQSLRDCFRLVRVKMGPVNSCMF